MQPVVAVTVAVAMAIHLILEAPRAKRQREAVRRHYCHVAAMERADGRSPRFSVAPSRVELRSRAEVSTEFAAVQQRGR